MLGSSCFVGGLGALNAVPLLPNYHFGYSVHKLVAANPYLPASVNFKNLTYTYNSELLPVSCIRVNDPTEWTNFYYRKVRKP